MQNDIKHYLAELGMHAKEIAVYEALVKLGEAPASRIAKMANMPRTTAISILEKFRDDSLISTHKYKGVAYYWIESPQVLVENYLAKAAIARELDGAFRGMYRSESRFPFAEIHDTRSGIRKFVEKTLATLPKKSEILTIETPHEGNYKKIYSENIAKLFWEQKKRKGVSTRTLVPRGTFADIEPEKLLSQDITIRELPPGAVFKGSLWIIDRAIVHFSGNPPFAVALQHEAISSGMRGIFEYLWAISDPQRLST